MNERFIIEGIPRGQGRPRACIRGRHAGVYKAKQDEQNESNIRAQIVAQRQGEPKLEYGALKLSAIFYMPRPKMHYNSKGQVKERYLTDEPTGKPDLDNLLKAVKDACNGVIWWDDSQVTSCHAVKCYAVDRPHTVIEVS